MVTAATTTRARIQLACLALVPLLVALRAAAAAQAADADVARRATAVATYNGGAVTVGEIEDTIADSSPLSQAHALEPDALHELLERNLRFELLAQEAERRGYRDDPRVRKAVKRNAVQLMISRDINARLRAEPPTPEQVRGYFDSHRQVFALHELRRATEIALESEAQARALLPRIKAADDDALRALVREHGLAVPSKAHGGDTRPFDAHGAPESGDAHIDPKLVKAVFALASVGDVSAVLQTDAGYEIVKLTEIRPGYEPTFEEVRVRVRRRLDDERYEDAIEAIARAQRERLHPKIRYELVDELHVD